MYGMAYSGKEYENPNFVIQKLFND